MSSLHIAKGLPFRLPESGCHHGKFSANQGKTGQKLQFIWCALVFSREFGRPKGAKFKIYLSFEDCRGFRCGSLFGAVVVSTGCRWCKLSRAQDLPEVGAGPLVVCSLLLSALSLCLWCIACKYGSISRFKGVFRGFPLSDVGLYWLGALRGLWGFCTRE